MIASRDARVRERIEIAGAGALARLPNRVARLLAGAPVRIDGQQLDVHVQLGLRLSASSRTGLFEGGPVAKERIRTRADARLVAGRTIELANVEDVDIGGAEGTIGGRLYVPAVAGTAAPMIVYFHGGGHVIGDLDTHDQPCRFLARETGAVVLAVDYRLAPEHPFPAAVDDSLAAFRWAHREAKRLGADPQRIAVAGDSAGGNLATVVALLAKRDGGPAPAFQALLYPVADHSAKYRSAELFGEGFFLTERQMDWFRDHYFANADDRLDPRGSPLLAEDLSGLAPALVVTAGFDPLRDEGEAYAERLERAGVTTILRRESDLIHGFVNAAGLGGRPAEALGAIAADLRTALAAAAAPIIV